MAILQYLPFLVMAVALVALALPKLAQAYVRKRNLHRVLCPTTGDDALVQLGRAPRGAHRCPVVDCSEWPRQRACSQECAHGLLYDASDAHSNADLGPHDDERAIRST